MKRLLLIFCITILPFTFKAQGPVLFDCPEYPTYGFFDRSCLIKTAYPAGEIQLPQGGVDGMSEERPMPISIPSNRPTWAIGIAHAWNYNRNIIQRVDHPKISYWMAITAHETGMACDCNAQWPAGQKPWHNNPGDYAVKCSEWITVLDGCFQMEEGNAWCGDLNQTWPWRFKKGEFTQNIGGDNFEIGCLGLAYRNILNHSLIDYAWGIDIWPIITYPTTDPNAYEKLMACGWNSWAGGLQQQLDGSQFAADGQGYNLYTTAGRTAAKASGNWNLAATSGVYPEVVGWAMNVLEQNTTSYYQYTNPFVTSIPGPSQNHVNYGYYNANITWADVNQYLTTIFPFYGELTVAQKATITQNVQNVFNAQAGGVAVQFKKLGPVIDEIILGLPKENPLMSTIFNDGLPAYNNGYRQCIGKLAPASHIENVSGNDTVCKGQSVVLEAMIDGGDGANMTYTWFKDGIAAGLTTKQIVVTPAALGNFVYTVNVCNTDLGGCAPACCPKTLVVQNCNACAIVATATTVNTPCQNMHGGKINLNIAGSVNYTITYASDEFSGSQTGTTAVTSINNLPDGVYNITIQDNVTVNCKFKLSAEVKFTTPMNEKLTAFIQSMTICDAVLKTKLEQDDCECEWSVYFDTPYAAWERDVFVIITPSNGSALRLRKDVLVNAYPAPTKATFKMCSGEHIKFEVEVQPSSGSCSGPAGYNEQNAPIEVYIKNPLGVKVLNQTIPIKTATQYNNYLAFDYTVTCPYTPGTYTYLWNPGAVTGTPANVSGMTPTTYTVVATNTANPQCSLTDTVYVPFNCNNTCVKPKAVISGSDSICSGDSTLISVALTGTKPFKIKLSNGATKWTVNNINANSYTFYAKNSGTYKVDSVWNLTCDTLGTGSAVVTVVNASVHLGNDTAVCTGANVTLNAGAGYSSYAWTGGGSAATKTVNAVGQYIVSITNSLGCSAKDTINVSFLPSPVVNFGNDTLAICPGKSLVLSPTYSGGTPGYTYLWSGAGNGTAATFNAMNQGNYKVTSTDSKGCKIADSVYVIVNSSLTINLTNKTICVGDTLTLNCGYDAVNYTILWNTNATTQSIKATTAGIYGVVVDDGNGCKGSDSMTLSRYVAPVVSLGADKNICPAATATLDAGAGFSSYQWSTGENSRTITKGAGTYNVLVSDANGCKARDTATVVSLSNPLVNLGKDIDTCSANAVVLSAQNANPGWTYLWSDNSTQTSLSINQTGTYSLTVTDINSCKGKDTLQANFRTKPVVDLLGGADSTVICEGETLTLDAGNTGLGISYSWNNTNGLQTKDVAQTGSYQVIVSNGNCSDTDKVFVQSVVLPQGILNDTLNPVLSNYCFEDDASVTLSAFVKDGNTYSYLWNTNETTRDIQVKEGGTYSVIMNLGICAVSDEVTLVDYCTTTFFVPNSFTPNGDNSNEVFYVVGEHIEDFELLIFDRWGEEIYNSKNVQAGWDGKYHGKEVQQDVYVWKVKYGINLPTGKTTVKERMGHVSVIY